MYVVITGATKGIGHEVAKIYAKRSRDLILVARTESSLEKMKSEFLKEYEINIITVSLDLSNSSDVDKLIKILDKHNFDTLINNAGYGIVEYFNKTDKNLEENILNLNIICFYKLFKYAYIKLQNIKKSYILNVGSVASFLPGPKSSVYFATKSFVKSITESVQYESTRQKNEVTISLICPPPIETQFMKRANMYIKSRKIKVDKVASTAIKKMEKGKLLIFPNTRTKIIYYINKVAPTKISKRIMFRKINKRNENV